MNQTDDKGIKFQNIGEMKESNWMITEWCGGGIKLNNWRIMVWYESNSIITECSVVEESNCIIKEC